MDDIKKSLLRVRFCPSFPKMVSYTNLLSEWNNYVILPKKKRV